MAIVVVVGFATIELVDDAAAGLEPIVEIAPLIMLEPVDKPPVGITLLDIAAIDELDIMLEPLGITLLDMAAIDELDIMLEPLDMAAIDELDIMLEPLEIPGEDVMLAICELEEPMPIEDWPIMLLDDPADEL